MKIDSYGVGISKVWYFGHQNINITPHLESEGREYVFTSPAGYDVTTFKVNNKVLKLEYRTGDSVINCQNAEWQDYNAAKFANHGNGVWCLGFIQIRTTYEGESLPPKENPLPKRIRLLML